MSRASLRAARGLVGRMVLDRGLDVGGVVVLPDVHEGRPDRVEYVQSGRRWLGRILPPGEVSADDVFVDFGSGKGAVVLRAARRYPFRRVIGVEISAELQAAARRNLERKRRRLRCRDVQLVTSDVVDYEIPPDMTVAYLFNPFLGEPFRILVDRIVHSLDARPRRLRVVYANPQMLAELLETGRFRVVRGLRYTRDGRATDVVLLESRP